jgi:uncharacterized surface protein with fasciclin (FAS1) repeats
MKYTNKCLLLLLGFVLVLFSACNNKWDDHNALNEARLSKNLYQVIGENTSLSKFYGYLQQTGYDTILTSSKTYTVWAPSDEALSNLDQNIINNDSLLKRFIGNHIAYREFPTDIAGNSIKIKMLNGKNIDYTCGSNTINGSTIESSNLFCQNGILHVISTPMYSKNSIWEYIYQVTDGSVDNLKKELELSVKTFDVNNSTRTGTNADGEDVYDSVWIYRNVFRNNISDINNEDSVFTVFALSNTAFNNEYTKMTPYLVKASSNVDSLIRGDIVKDIVVRGKYNSYTDMPDTLYSTQGIKIPKDKISISGSYEASNGMVFIVSTFDIPLVNKIPNVIIEGENYFDTYNTIFSHVSVPLLGIRAKSWASGGKDIYIPGGSTGHTVVNLSVGYNSPKLYSISYNVYWRAVNDFQSSTFTQKIAINAHSFSDIIATGDVLVQFKTVNVGDYSEVFLGVMNNQNYGNQKFYLVANSDDSKSPNNPLVLDYLKLVPVF